MTGESTRSNSVRPCNFISNGQYLSPCATKFDSPHTVTNSLSYFSVSNVTEPQPFISDFSYIETYPVQTSTNQPIPPTSIQNNERMPPTKQTDTETVTVYLSTKKKYKPVALKVKPHIGTLPDKFRIIRNIIGDPLKDLPTLPVIPPAFTPTGRYKEERKEIFDKINAGFLLPLERVLLHYFMMVHNDGFAWETSERGHFREDFFPPVDIPAIPHKPWVQRNSHIPPGLYDEFC